MIVRWLVEGPLYITNFETHVVRFSYAAGYSQESLSFGLTLGGLWPDIWLQWKHSPWTDILQPLLPLHDTGSLVDTAGFDEHLQKGGLLDLQEGLHSPVP